MNAVLDFPSIVEPPAAAPPAPAATEQTRAITASIGVVQGEVAKFDQIAAGLAAIEAAHPKNVIVAAIDTPAGMKMAEASWRAYRSPRLEVERARKAAKAPVLALGKAIDTFAGGLEERLREGEDHYKAQIDAEEQRRAAIKAEQERIEREKAEQHAARLAMICAYAEHCRRPDMTAERIAAGMAQLQAAVVADEDKARQVELADAQCRTLETMRTLHAQAVAREAEAARQEAIRLENERLARELAAERERIAAETAALRRQAEELAAQRAESERLEALAVANRERLAREAQAEAAAAVGVVAAPGQYPGNVESKSVLKRLDAQGATLLQDECRGLSVALASKPDAMQHAREAAEAIAQAGPVTAHLDDTPAEPDPAAAALNDLQALAAEARASKFPTQPKMGMEWWARFYVAADFLAGAA